MKNECEKLYFNGKGLSNSVIIYGAGKMGEVVYEAICNTQDMEVFCFCDRDTEKQKKMGGGVKVISLEELKEQSDINKDIIIAIKDRKQAMEVKENLQKEDIERHIWWYVDLIGTRTVEENREDCANFHIAGMDEYFLRAEKEESLQTFWGKNSPFYCMFQKLDLTKVVELACGKGRHVQKYLNQAEEIVLVDILGKNIDFCKNRFHNNSKVTYYTNKGYDLEGIADATCTALFTYDAMVHFESIDVYHYLQETYRILKKGGKALFHHSNNHDYQATFLKGMNGRNYMTMDLFSHFADRAGLEVLEQRTYDWNAKDLDGITLVRKV